MHPELRWAIYARDAGVCGLCGDPVHPDDLDIDHIVERVAGGTDESANLRATHSECNRRRGARGVPGAYARPYSLGADAVRVSVHHVPADLHERVKRRSGQDMRSLNLEILWLLAFALETLEAGQQPKQAQAEAS